MLSKLRNQVESWWQKAPIPVTTSAQTRPRFQKWHRFHQGHWTPLVGKARAGGIRYQWAGTFHLVSWNVNADAPSPRSRISALLRVVETTTNADIIFLQEVSKDALTTLLSNPWIQQHWYTSEADSSTLGKQLFKTVTLISKSCLATHSVLLGAIWRVPLPSRFERDALCCDLLINPSGGRSLRIRLINVHLDSLPINPSRRPQQLSLIASYLCAAGRGLVAGDFNPVLPEDDGIVSSNGLVDAWARLYPTDPGFTWGVYGENYFPPNRLDRVALLNLTPSSMRILRTCALTSHGTGDICAGKGSDSRAHFSDHFGLFCEFGWAEDTPISLEC